MKKILACRTPALGGELFACPECRGFHYRYHSCNDRHCPQCGQSDADEWLQRQQARLLLPTPCSGKSPCSRPPSSKPGCSRASRTCSHRIPLQWS
ncbi:MAG: transposase zinc-binding domain-containing protein [Verrucomicrobia bacterium]|nr:transposase zinc-binding domain-containing protein [Verrucomicrobiota bacterium]